MCRACIQLFLLLTLYSSASYLALISLATSMILLPYLFSGMYALKLTWQGETYAGHRALQLRDMARRCSAVLLMAAVRRGPQVHTAQRLALRTRFFDLSHFYEVAPRATTQRPGDGAVDHHLGRGSPRWLDALVGRTDHIAPGPRAVLSGWSDGWAVGSHLYPKGM